MDNIPWNLNQNTIIFNQENAFKISSAKCQPVCPDCNVIGSMFESVLFPESIQATVKSLILDALKLGNKIIDNSDVVGASPVGAAPTTSSFST